MGDKKKEGKKASQAADDEYDYLYKVVVIGDSSVGKSNLLSRFTKNEFFLDSRPTIGVEFAAKNVTVDSKIIKAQIWDTAGQERFRAITEAYYRRAVGALLVYDITRRSTFINLQHWLDELYLHAGKSTVVILVGNKSDLGFKREVSTEEGKVFAEKNHLGFLETSALEATNVGDAFNLVITGVYEEMGRKSLENRKDAYNDFKGVVIPSPPVPSKEKPNNNPCCG